MDEQKQKRIANYLGIAQKAGFIAAGDTSAKEALQKGKARLLVIAEDASPKVKEELLALVRNTPVLYWPDKNSLGCLLGKSRRGSVALLDQGFADAILKVLSPDAVGDHKKGNNPNGHSRRSSDLLQK